MDVVHRTEVVKCPKSGCANPIHISVGRWPGGENDRGGWVLKCEKCGHVFPVDMLNPDDASSVRSGATVLDSWDNDVAGSREHALANHSSDHDSAAVERLLVHEHGEPETFYNLTTTPLYRCGSCKNNLEINAYSQLEARLPEVNKAFSQFLNWYLANRCDTPEAVSVWLELYCACGAKHRARFYKPFSEYVAQDSSEYWLVDVIGDKLAIDIDGIYSRDDCITILEKLLLRWRALHCSVLLASPFVGFNYPGARKKIPALWNWMMKYTDPNKTAIVTRRATFKLLKDAAKETEFDVEFLKSWGLLNPTLAEMDQKKAFFKANFHAKFYCGMSADRVEVLVGSFNIHEGTFVENIHLLSYTFDEFHERYLSGMKLDINLGALVKPRFVIEISCNDNGDTVWKDASYVGSLHSAVER